MGGGPVWAGLLAAGAVFEAQALRAGRCEDTLSACTRAAFRAHHPAGRLTFTFAWLALSAWWLPHVTHGTCWPFGPLLPSSD